MGGLRAVVFDLGGVVFDSPLHAIARYEHDLGLAPNTINRAIVGLGEGGAWPRLERGELTLTEFYPLFDAECAACGVSVSGERMMAAIAQASRPRPGMLAAIRRLRGHGLRVGALTNNWRREDDDRGWLREEFHAFVESSVVGLRKPDPRIYGLVCEALGVAPLVTAFLDDIGRNLKAARALGMTTIKVDDPDQALRELGAALGLDLLA